MKSRLIIVLCMTLLIAGAGEAWGPRTQLSIVSNALYVLSKEENIPLERLERNIRAGVMISNEVLLETYPSLESNPVEAIELEMRLLQRVKPDRVDAYFAYRLGMLGKMVAVATAPMRGVDPTFRNLYYADVESHIEGIALKSGTRQLVDPVIYFPPVLNEARIQNEAIIREYQNGRGFDGLPGLNLSNDASRSVRAVADSWFSILTRDTLPGNVSEAQLQQYVIDAYAFYIHRKNTDEIDIAAERLNTITPLTIDMRVKIGDLYYNAELFDRAMEQYKEVKAAAPERRDVMEKIAEYNMRRGQDALRTKNLETALEAFQTAVDANPLHPLAEKSRLETLSLIAARDARLAANQDALNRAKEFQTQAEQEGLSGNFAKAIAFLKQAENAFNEVTDEFPTEFQLRTRGLNDVRYRTQELKQNIMENAQALSGSGFETDVQELAKRPVADLEKNALLDLVRQNLSAELQNLQNRMQPALTFK
ncbi:MAG TPA: hypothetical protein PLI09_28710 [Candidatus Hydrogenedentes bacterium]|nr:hypothetical protein [Candidatus Hydrogenedentota bacterium]